MADRQRRQRRRDHVARDQRAAGAARPRGRARRPARVQRLLPDPDGAGAGRGDHRGTPRRPDHVDRTGVDRAARRGRCPGRADARAGQLRRPRRIRRGHAHRAGAGPAPARGMRLGAGGAAQLPRGGLAARTARPADRPGHGRLGGRSSERGGRHAGMAADARRPRAGPGHAAVRAGRAAAGGLRPRDPRVGADVGVHGPHPASPAPGWLRVALSSQNVTAGLMEEDAVVWDSEGRFVAQSRQLCGIRTPR